MDMENGRTSANSYEWYNEKGAFYLQWQWLDWLELVADTVKYNTQIKTQRLRNENEPQVPGTSASWKPLATV